MTVVKNYVLKQLDDGSYSQYLLTYHYFIDGNGDLVCDTDFLGIEFIEGDSLVMGRGSSCVPQFTQVDSQTVCIVRFHCTGGGHEMGDDKCLCGTSDLTCEPAGMSCNDRPIFGWTTCTSGGGTDEPDPNQNPETDDNTGGGGTVNTDDDETTISVPIPKKTTNRIDACMNMGHDNSQTEEGNLIQFFNVASYNLTTQQYWDINSYLLVKNQCSEEAKEILIDFFEILEEFPNAKIDRYVELLDRIEIDPWFLIQNCVEQNGLDTSNYLDLYELPFPQECTAKLFNLGLEFHHQPFSDGNVPLANIDYYSVEITQYPDFNDDNLPDSESEMFLAFRNKFIDLASGQVEDFEFGCNVVGNSDNTGTISWEFEPMTNQDGLDFVSNNPITSILFIEADASGLFPHIATDDGAVIVSELTVNDFTISTIRSPNNGTQPFSGNRQWGWIINESGNFEFFTRAVDVANISKLLNFLPGGANTECQQDTYYNIAGATWENMQQEIAQWVNDNDGQANIVPSQAKRVDKETIEEILTSNESIDEIISDCN